ncbi:hypothetical protein [Bacteroides faecium]|uniref:Fimbrillin family protein n=1 Tax=Bacteroides faecium TaxID=2715212 RepID=A0A6H0KQY3_9BACE|nr:hypothetical protein [Bacteroides faecium]QIU95772.1 hypothetical protein BacF7301_17160 [Bacteroides faecium]
MIRNIFLLMLSALCAWSCTDNLPGDEAPTDGRHSLNITVGPKPAFTDGTLTRADGTTLPETRAVQTDKGPKWEEGDVVWLYATFHKGKEENVFYSALKYTGGAWRYLNEDETATLKVNNIPGFNRTLIYDNPDGSTEYDNVRIYAYYVGKDWPDKDGDIHIPAPGSDEAIPVMGANSITSSFSQPITLSFTYLCSRLRLPAGCSLQVDAYKYWTKYHLSNNSPDIETAGTSLHLDATSADRDIYLLPVANNQGTPASITLTRSGGATWTFKPRLGTGTATGASDYYGQSYTLPDLGNGSVTPGGM